MDAKELKQIVNDLAKAMTDHPTFDKVLTNYLRIVSYLESEQRERKEVTDAMKGLSRIIVGENGDPGFSERLRNSERQSKHNGKLLWMLIILYIGGIIALFFKK